jgi:hypothetical protein
MVCPPGKPHRTERQLEVLKRGEIRWSDRAGGWEVLIPAVAFKNADSSFFSGKPFRCGSACKRNPVSGVIGVQKGTTIPMV